MMDGYIGQMDRWIGGCMYGWINLCMDECMYGWMIGAWIDDWMDRWIDA
jgi:hypothetical protein